jgi:hypothetical protein
MCVLLHPEGDPCVGIENACMCPGRFDVPRPADDVFHPCQRVAHRIEEYDYENTSQVSEPAKPQAWHN